MDPIYLNKLPPDVKELVAKIELQSGSSVGVRVEPAVEGEDGQGTLKCRVDVFGADILLPAPEHFPVPSVYHELLHARRNLVDGVPQLVGQEGFPSMDTAMMKAICNLDNQLEHLVIVPLELKRFPEREDYWDSKVRKMLQEDLQKLAKDDKRRQLLMSWAFVCHVLGDCPAQTELATQLAVDGLGKEAASFAQTVIPLCGDKPSLCRAVIDDFRLSRQMVVLEYTGGKKERVAL